MSNEITITAATRFTKGNVKDRGISNAGVKVTMAGNGWTGKEILVGEGGTTAIDVSTLGTPGRFHFMNTGNSDIIVYTDAGATQPAFRIKAGRPAMGDWEVQLYVQAEATSGAAGSRLDYMVLEA